ncbi:MAG: RNase adapter RapZ [Myxococcaceae bacterium]|nr:RNase adapter RapZ [Myxococcaceae bacterium]
MTAPAGKNIVVITGMSGSGKSTAVRALEDAGWFCIDNLPAPLLLKVTELGGETQRLAFVMDVREMHFLRDAPKVLDEARRAGHTVEVLFLDASDDSLVRRYSETRRKHPLSMKGTAAEGVAKEREALQELREQSQHVLDTSAMTVHELKRQVQSRFGDAASTALAVTVMSFGFKYGVPPQADLVFDVRFLPNPYYVPELKALTGRDAKVAAYVLERPETQTFITKTKDMLDFLMPNYVREGKAYLTVAIGCTGGKHRSVAIAAQLAQHYKQSSNVAVHTFDRDVDKE